MSETPLNTPEEQKISQVLPTKRKIRTKIIKKGSEIMATIPYHDPAPMNKENVKPTSSGPGEENISDSSDNEISFKRPVVAKRKKKRKRIVASISRRSSIDFIQVRQSSQSRTRVKSQKATVALPPKEFVLTACTLDDQNLAQEMVKRLPGKAKVALQVGPSTTHVICGEEKRTLNMLKAILRGCWILSRSWLLASLEAQGWVDEEPYECVTFSSAVRARRLEREAEFLPQRCSLLSDIGPIYIGKFCRVPKKELAELIHIAGGRIANQIRLAKVVLGHEPQPSLDENVIQVGESWLLDSFQQFCPLPFVDYMTRTR